RVGRGCLRRSLARGSCALTAGQAGGAPTDSLSCREGAGGVGRELRRIVTPHGVERNEAGRIGGIDRFVSVRGDDRRNPILLMIHGGPGFPTAPMAWFATHGSEEY